MKEQCGTCRHGGKVVAYKDRRKKLVIWCDRKKKPVEVDDICVSYESWRGKKLF